MFIRIISLIVLFLSYAPNHVFGHGAVQRASELKDSEIRLFVADNMNGSVVVVDFPDGEVTHRVSTSPSIMILASNKDNKYIYAMRGRDTDDDLTSILSTGFDLEEKQFRKPHVIRTIKTDTPGGPRDSKMATVGGYDAILTEGEAEVVVGVLSKRPNRRKLRRLMALARRHDGCFPLAIHRPDALV